MNNISGNGTSDTSQPSTVAADNLFSDQLLCSEGFFFDENGTGFCRPECGEFMRAPTGIVTVELVTICISIAASVLMFILAMTCQRSIL